MAFSSETWKIPNLSFSHNSSAPFPTHCASNCSPNPFAVRPMLFSAQSSLVANEKSILLLPPPHGLVRENVPMIFQAEKLQSGEALTLRGQHQLCTTVDQQFQGLDNHMNLSIKNLMAMESARQITLSQHENPSTGFHHASCSFRAGSNRSSSPSSSITNSPSSFIAGRSRHEQLGRPSDSPSDTPSPSHGESSPEPSACHKGGSAPSSNFNSQEKTAGRRPFEEPTRNKPRSGSSSGTEPSSSSSSSQEPTAAPASGRKRSWKILLTAELAASIYAQRPRRGESTGPSSLEVASRCGVNSKTIRDIWNRETWVRATRVLWTAEEETLYREALRAKGDLSPDGDSGGGVREDGEDGAQAMKRRGRPKGVKDSRPRKSRCTDSPATSVSGALVHAPASPPHPTAASTPPSERTHILQCPGVGLPAAVRFDPLLLRCAASAGGGGGGALRGLAAMTAAGGGLGGFCGFGGGEAMMAAPLRTSASDRGWF